MTLPDPSAERATPRPWRVEWYSGEDMPNRIVGPDGKQICESGIPELMPDDAQLIVAAVNSYDSLKAENSRLTEENEELRKENAIFAVRKVDERVASETIVRLRAELAEARQFLGKLALDTQDIDTEDAICKFLRPSENARCKHGVWAADHCWKCDERLDAETQGKE